MIWFVIILLLVVFHSMNLQPVNSFNKEYLSKTNTNIIKGIFCVLILISHASQYIALSGAFDIPYETFRNHLNQMVVVMFFFYSGYGIMEQINKIGSNYIKSIPYNRLLSVLINNILAVFLYLILQTILGNFYSLQHILLAFIGYTNLGNSNWYIFAIIISYLLLFIAWMPLLINKKKTKASFYLCQIIFTVLIILFIYWQMRIGRPWYSFDTIIFIAVGGWYSLLKAHLEKILLRKDFLSLLIFTVTFILYAFLIQYRYKSIFIYSLWGGMFLVLVLIITTKITFSSSLLEFIGSHIFPFYILQRIPMIIMHHIGLSSTHKYFFVIIAFLITLLMILPFEKMSAFIISRKNKCLTYILR